MMEKDLLETEAELNGVFISDLRQDPLLTKIIADILSLEEEAHPLSQWSNAISYPLNEPRPFSTVAGVKERLRQILPALGGEGKPAVQ